MPVKVENNKNYRHVNNPRPIPILIGDQKIIVSSAAIPQISSKKTPLPSHSFNENNKNKNEIIKQKQLINTTKTASKPLLFMKTSIQKRNNRGGINSNNNTNNNKIILTENPG